jgi:hypothetical protein
MSLAKCMNLNTRCDLLRGPRHTESCTAVQFLLLSERLKFGSARSTATKSRPGVKYVLGECSNRINRR